MSYCRFGVNSDAYVFEHVRGGYECCACCLADTALGSFLCATPNEMIEHLRKHVAAGHQIPATAFARLRRQAEEGVDDAA